MHNSFGHFGDPGIGCRIYTARPQLSTQTNCKLRLTTSCSDAATGGLPGILWNKGTVVGTPNREPQEYKAGIQQEYEDTGRYIRIIFLLHSLGAPLGMEKGGLKG